MRRIKTEDYISPPPEVDKPTYEIVGVVERYDQRDHPTARIYMKEGSTEYRDYYSRHPELKEWDDRCRKLKAQSYRKNWENDPVNEQLPTSIWYARRCLGLPEIVEGRIESRYEGWKDRKISVDPDEISQKIKDFGIYLGADKVRITKLNQNWVYTHYAHPYTPKNYGEPVQLNYNYIICLAFRQDLSMMKSGNGLSQFVEVGWNYTYASLVSVIIAHFIRSLGWPAIALPPENSPYIVPPVFIDAGMGEQGRCTYVVTKEFGNNFRPGAVATNMPLSIDKPVNFGLQDFCEKCKICAEACPVGAIPKGNRQVVRGVLRWHYDAEKCRKYWDTIGRSCGICQVVCPWSLPNKLHHNIIRSLNQNFSSLRTFFIKTHQSIYGKFKRTPLPEWMKIKAVKENVKKN